MRRSVVLLLVLGYLISACGGEQGAVWQGYGGDGYRSLVARERGPSRGRLKWVVDLEGTEPGMPVVDEHGSIYIPHSGGSVTKLNKAGKLAWRFDSWVSQKGAAPPWLLVQPKNYLLMSTLHQEQTFRLSPQGESTAGTPWLPWPASRNPAQTAKGYTVATHQYVTGPNSVALRIYGLVSIGSPIWQLDYSTPDIVWSASIPAVTPDGRAYVFVEGIGGEDNFLLAIDSSGEILWQLNFDPTSTTGVNLALAVGSDGTVYLGTTRIEDVTKLHSPGWLYAVSAQGKLLWRYEAGQRVAQVMVAPSMVVANILRTRLVALNKKGKTLWEYTLEGWESNAVMDSRGQVFLVGVREGTVWFKAVNNRGRLAWEVDSGQEASSVGFMIISGGRLLVTTDRGKFIAIGD